MNPGPCVVDFTYEDPNQHVLKHVTMTIMPGHAAFVDLTAAELATLFREQRRIELLPFLRFARHTRVIGSVEMFDTLSGKTETFTNVLVEDPNL